MTMMMMMMMMMKYIICVLQPNNNMGGLQHAWKCRVVHTKFGHTATTEKVVGRFVQMFKRCLPSLDATPCVVILTTNPSYSI